MCFEELIKSSANLQVEQSHVYITQTKIYEQERIQI